MSKEKADAIQALQRLAAEWPRVEGPEDPAWHTWLGEVRGHLPRIDGSAAVRFDHLARYMMLPLSALTLEPLWNDMLATIRAAVAQAKLSQRDLADKVYAPGESSDLARDLAKILGTARRSIFLIEPYVSDTIFQTYLQGVDA